MSEGPSDPDLLNLDDLPDTGTVETPTMARMLDAVRALARWQRRQHGERKADRAQVATVTRSVLAGSGTVVVALATALWYAATLVAEVRAETRALREDVTEVRDAIERVEERQWTGGDRWRRVDVSTGASSEE